jgi:hypothetical protein
MKRGGEDSGKDDVLGDNTEERHVTTRFDRIGIASTPTRLEHQTNLRISIR